MESEDLPAVAEESASPEASAPPPSPGGAPQAPSSPRAAAVPGGSYPVETRSGAGEEAAVRDDHAALAGAYRPGRREASAAGGGRLQDSGSRTEYDIRAWASPSLISKGRLGAYVGLAGEAAAANDFAPSVWLAPGVNYRPRRWPLEIFLEARPVLRAAPGPGVEPGAGLGLRYYFKKK